MFKNLRINFFCLACLLSLNSVYAQKYSVTNAKGTIFTLVNNQVFVSAVTPSDAFEADVWFNTSDRVTYVYDGAFWREIDEDRVTTSLIAPIDPVQGDVWFDNSALLITTNVYDGTNWLLVSSSDDQLLSIDGDSLRLEDGGAVALDSLQDGDAWGVNEEDITSSVGRNGSVGIGILLPASKLHVEGDARITVLPVGDDKTDEVVTVDYNGNLRKVSVDNIDDQQLAIDGDSLRLINGGAVGLNLLSNDDQILSIDGDSLELEDGGAVALSDLGTDDQILSIVGDSLELEDGGAVALSDLGTDDQILSIVGDSLELEDGGAVALSDLGTDDQILSIDGDSLELEDGGAVALSDLGTDDQILSIDGDSLELEDGGAVALSDLGTDDQILSIDGDSLELEDGGAVALSDLGTDDQILSIVGDSLELEDGGAVALSDLGTDDQILSIDGDSLELEDGGAVALSDLGTDDQILSIDGDSLELEDGGAVALSDLGTDDQILSIDGDSLELEDGGAVALSDLGTDDQILSIDGDSLELEDGGAVALSDLGTDDQILSIVGDSLELEDGGAVALSDLGTDDQILSIDGDSLRLEDGGAVALNSFELIDDDGDTQIQLEESVDDDIIRFDAGGTEMANFSSSQANFGTQQTIANQVILTSVNPSGFEAYNNLNFNLYNLTSGSYTDGSALFNNNFETASSTYHAFRDVSGVDWGFGYSFDNSYVFSSIRLRSRGDCCGARVGGGEIRIYNAGVLVATSSIINSPGTGQWTTAYIPNVVGDEIRYIFPNGANTDIGDDTFNASEFEISGSQSSSVDLTINGNASITGQIFDSGNSAGAAGQVLSATATGTDWADAVVSIWKNNTNGGMYVLNDLISYDGAIYRSLTGTNTNITPEIDITNWRNLDTPFASVTNELLFDDGSPTGYLYVSLVINNAWQVTRFKKDDPNDEGVANIGNNSTTTTQPTTLALCQGLMYTP